MRNYLRIPAGLVAVTAMMTAAFSCSSKKTRSVSEATTAETNTAEASTQNDKYSSDKMAITWLSYYDINPEGSSDRSVALSLFEDKYNGSVNYIQTDRKSLIPKLEAMIAAGEEVDMFPYELSVFPDSVTKGVSAPLDPYFEEMGMGIRGLWDSMNDVTELFAYNGQHYIVPYEAISPVVIIYSRKLMEQEGFEDPCKLYKDGKWNWDTFTEMMDKFAENAADGRTRYGICGSYGQALIQSAGNVTVSYGAAANNSAEVEKANKLIQEISEKNLYLSGWRDCFPTDGSTLFMAAEDWTLGKSNAENEDMDLMAVPFPKSPDTPNYSIICDFNADMLAANSQKGSAVATFMMCERYAATEKKFMDAKKQLTVTPQTAASGTVLSFVTEEQYDALQSYLSNRDNLLMPDLGYKTEY